MTFPKVKLSTLIALHAIAAGLLWLNVQEGVLQENALIVPLGWPNDAAMIFQESYHQVRAKSGFTPSWGEVDWAALAANAITCVTILALSFAVLEFKQLRFTRPARNTVWIMAATVVGLLAINAVEHGASGTQYYGWPFPVYSGVTWLISDTYKTFYTGMPMQGANLFANIATAMWLLLGVYAISQRLFAKRKPAPTASSICSTAGP